MTRRVHAAGCASKISQADLARVLSRLPPVEDPRVLCGVAAGDDAGVYQLNESVRLVQTVDVFSPCVDDPFLFGRIAAANSLSDVYAMGGVPLTALSIVGFPIEELPDEVLSEMLRGGMSTLAEAGCALLGGHSINETEVKLGFAVTGLVEGPFLPRAGARPGDSLVLTKPLGTGMVAFAAQIGRLPPASFDDAARSMATLNRDAARLLRQFGAHGCTDITGFGLAGHAVAMATDSRAQFEIDLGRLPVFSAVPACLREGVFPGAVERNQTYAMAWVEAPETAAAVLPVLYDPQTSGGLLVALPAAQANAYVEALHGLGHSGAAVIGRVLEPGPGRPLRVVNMELGRVLGSPLQALLPAVQSPDSAADVGPSGPPVDAAATPAPACCEGDAAGSPLPAPAESAAGCTKAPATAAPGCCSGMAAATAPASAGRAEETLDLFRGFMQAASAPGLIDARAKKLMAIQLSISERCRPCLEIHLKGALAQGLSWAEIDEAANLAIAFGGGPALMFYREVRGGVRQTGAGH